MTKILEGKPVANRIYHNLQREITLLKKEKITPSLGVVLVGNHPASLAFISKKQEACQRLKIGFKLYKLDEDIKETELIKLIKKLNNNPKVHGILVQIPLPNHLDSAKIISQISINKDVDGFGEENLKNIIYRRETFAPAVAEAVLEILEFYKISLKGKKIVILGRGRYVGQVIASKLISLGFRPVVGHKKTKNLESIIKAADILISAIGQPSFIKKYMVKKKVVIIDVGTSYFKGKIIGDADFSELGGFVSAITPTPGGVGPVTVACLLKNVVRAARIQNIKTLDK